MNNSGFISFVCDLQERREREQQDLEYAKEMAEEDDDGFPWVCLFVCNRKTKLGTEYKWWLSITAILSFLLYDWWFRKLL